MNYIIVWPSWSWKDTLIRDILDSNMWNDFLKITSDTTRDKRVWEIEWYHYNFKTKEQFDKEEHFNSINYNWNTYWFSNNEVQSKVNSWKHCLVIVEPNWIDVFVDFFNSINKPYKVIFININEEDIIKRLIKRWDDIEKSMWRIKNDHKYFLPWLKRANKVLDWSQSALYTLNQFTDYHNEINKISK